MESMLMLLILAGLAAVIGGLASFFSLINGSSRNERQKLKNLERELAQLRQRLEVLEQVRGQASTVAAAESTPPAALRIPMPVEPQQDVPIFDASIPRPEISEEELISQALSTPPSPAEATPHATAVPPRPKRAVPPPAPVAPNVIEKGLLSARNWLFGGNTLVRSGVVILFIGVSFLLKFAVDNNFIPIELRLAAVALGGITLLALGWRLRDQRTEFSWALQGGGVGVLYLTIFAALKLYQLIPAGAAFALLFAVALLSALIAVLQSAMPLAILGFTGGFLAPIFTSTGQGSHVGLFSYYLVLNLAIAFIAFRKGWRPLNVLGFAFTFIIGTLWGAKNYEPAMFATTEPFLVIHFLLFTLIAVLYAQRQATRASDYVDATLVFGTPIVAFSLQYALLRDSHFGLAYSAMALGIFYLGLAWWVVTRRRDTLKFLGECFLALGVGFLTLTLPLALDGRWTSAAWAVEGVGLVWVGLRQHRQLPLASGLALQLLAAIAFAKGWGLTGFSDASQQNLFLGVGFIALSGWACGALLNRDRTGKWSSLTMPLALWGWVWWVGAGMTAIDEFSNGDALLMHLSLLFIAATSALLPYLARWLKWPQLERLGVLLLPAMLLALLVEAASTLFGSSAEHPFKHFGGIGWLASFAVYGWLLRRDAIAGHAMLRAPLLWMMAVIGGMEWQYQLNLHVHEASAWHEIGWALIPTLLVVAVIHWQFGKKTAPDTVQLASARVWGWVACAPLMVYLVAWFVFASLNSSGAAAPLPYVPLINPLDIALTAVLLLLLIWQRAVSRHLGKLQHLNPRLAALMAFALLNGMLLRTMHHWLGTPFQWTALMYEPRVQMAFTFLWGFSAFGLMLLAHKREQRMWWMAGAALMGLVVVKIFLLDLAQRGSVERIVSFIGAGMLLLVMGYFAPLPPAKPETAKPVRA